MKTIKIYSMLYLKFFLFGMLLVLTSCKKDDDIPNPIDQLPPATQTGENTFGCLINGELFSITNSSQIGAIYQGGLLQLSGSISKTNFNQSVGFNLYDPLLEGQMYTFENSSYKAGYSLNINNIMCFYEFEDTYKGNITITTFDKTNYIISGTFSFSTITDGCEEISITNGRFDVHYIP